MYYYDKLDPHPLKVLVVEDNAEIQSILEYLLLEDGYKVVTCADGSSISNLHNIQPDLIVLDELLPAVKGSDLCRQIKNQPSTKHIPVVIISALAGVGKIAKDCGADGFVEKPFNIDSFTGVIKALTGK